MSDIDPASNSFKSREERAKQPPKLEPIITGKVQLRKEPLWKRVLEAFFGDPGERSIGDHILFDVIIPGARDLTVNSLNDGIDQVFYGESRSSRRRPQSQGQVTRTNYTNYANQPRHPAAREPKQVRSVRDYKDVLFETRSEADMILSRMIDHVLDFGRVSVADLYDLCGVTEEFTDYNFGWTDLTFSSIRHTRGGYFLDLPEPVTLN